MSLTNEQRYELNQIYIQIMKKYKVYSTSSINLDKTVPAITQDEARDLAEMEMGDKAAKIIEEYNERIALINQNAINRGMESCSVVLNQLDKALVKKNDALARLENMTTKRAKQILTENQKLRLAVEKEKSSARSRTLRDTNTIIKLDAVHNYNAQTLADDEVYYSYYEWLMQFSPEDAYNYLSDYVFIANMSIPKYNQLQQEINTRRSLANV